MRRRRSLYGKGSSCCRMRDVFRLQCQFLQIVFVQKEGNTRPEGFKMYFITPPGYLSSCSLKRPLNYSQFTPSAPDWVQRARIPNLPSAPSDEYQKPSLSHNLEYVSFQSSSAFITSFVRTIPRFLHTHPELGYKSVCVL